MCLTPHFLLITFSFSYAVISVTVCPPSLSYRFRLMSQRWHYSNPSVSSVYLSPHFLSVSSCLSISFHSLFSAQAHYSYLHLLSDVTCSLSLCLCSHPRLYFSPSHCRSQNSMHDVILLNTSSSFINPIHAFILLCLVPPF